MATIIKRELATAMSRLGTETAFVVLARAKELEAKGKSVIHLEIGEPDFDTPPNIVEAGIRALREGWTHYGPSHGLPELRETIAAEVSRSRAVEVSAADVLVTPGAKPILFFSILALCNPGDEVLIPDPGFPIYESMVNYVGAVPVSIPLLPENEFRIDLDHFESLLSDKTKLLILNSPNNPTGGTVPRKDIERIAELVRERGIFVLTDEVYQRIIYDDGHFSILSVDGMADQTILLDGFSKTYAMTGWRMGYSVAPRWLTDAMAQLQTNSTSCTASFIQRAGIEALTGPQDSVKAMGEEFRQRRDQLVGELNAIDGVSCKVPGGAFYVFPQVEGFRQSAEELATGLLDEAGVAVLAGTAFGPHGKGSFRLSFANSRENLHEAARRINDYLQGSK